MRQVEVRVGGVKAYTISKQMLAAYIEDAISMFPKDVRVVIHVTSEKETNLDAKVSS